MLCPCPSLALFSSPMPETTLKTYVRDIAALRDGNAVMVMRGFIDGIKKPKSTMAFIKRLSQNGEGGSHKVKTRIDPHIFAKFGVGRVPAVIHAWNLEPVDAIQSVGMPGNLAGEPEAVVVFGDAALDHALEKIYEGTGRPTLKGAVKKNTEKLLRWVDCKFPECPTSFTESAP